jgi:hypothetical protein
MLALGSCFADEMGRRLAEAKFRIEVNPSGVMFNPCSVARLIARYAERRYVTEEELQHEGERWFHYDFHGVLSASDAQRCCRQINDSIALGAAQLQRATVLIVTLGTAWVYTLASTGEVVANCHKQSATLFRRRRLTVGEVCNTLGEVVERYLAGKRVIMTVSPVRHIGDGLAGNAVSKATLRLAAEQLQERYPAVSYFPAYEILCDDLRDYRFYASDLVHPSTQGVDYVWEKFQASQLSESAQQLLPRVMAVVVAAKHRPQQPQSASYRDFCRRQLAAVAALPQVNFAEETALFRHYIELNS